MAQFTNQAQIRYGNAVANSNIAVGEILEVLSASKTAVRTTSMQEQSLLQDLHFRITWELILSEPVRLHL